ncbi:T9SS type A sorting domain-containing protein [candidate division KSB1 bacterium]|nr:T9SS type A sorting domain-containing protein [candidate division KSB1 bacterium]
MNVSKKLLQTFIIVTLVGFVFTGTALSESIAFVGGGTWVDETGYFNEQPYIDLLEFAGYEVTVYLDSMRGAPLTVEQIEKMESHDLIIVGRTTNSGDYNDPEGWNSVGKPLILFSVYLSRANRWQWFPNDNLISNGRSGAPGFKVVDPDHPIFAGLTPDADGIIYPLDPTIGCGNTSLVDNAEAGDEGVIIATAVSDLATVEEPIAIVYWPADAYYHWETEQFAAAPRLLFPCSTQEDAGSCDQQGEYNLTQEGDQMFLNAVAFMLGKEVSVEKAPATAPADFALKQNFPNPFNPSTNIEFTISAATNVKLGVYNTLGQEVATLANQIFQSGTHTVTWDGRNSKSETVESGVYFYKLETENQTSTKKMLLVK